jgi:hypothetical protein
LLLLTSQATDISITAAAIAITVAKAMLQSLIREQNPKCQLPLLSPVSGQHCQQFRAMTLTCRLINPDHVAPPTCSYNLQQYTLTV